MLGNVVGSWIAYAVGYYGRLELLEKNRFIHVNRKHLDWADSWFQRHGDATVFFTRMLPIIRTFISLPAGRRADAVLALHRPHRCSAASRGCCCSALIGAQVGDNWEEWRDKLHYLDYVVLAAIVGRHRSTC